MCVYIYIHKSLGFKYHLYFDDSQNSPDLFLSSSYEPDIAMKRSQKSPTRDRNQMYHTSSTNIWLTHPSSLLISGSINIIPPEA